MDQPWSRALPLDCHDQRSDGEFGAHMIAHCPADHFAGEEIEDHGQVKPTFAVGMGG